MTWWSTSKSGATKRHMFWSHPYPWAKTIGRPSGTPLTRMSFRVLTITRPRYPPSWSVDRPVAGWVGAHVRHHDPAPRPGRDAPQRDAEVLRRQAVLQPGQPDDEGRQQGHGDLLARTAVVVPGVTGALRHQLPVTDLPDGAPRVEEPLGPEAERLREHLRVVVLPPQVQQHGGAGRYPL